MFRSIKTGYPEFVTPEYSNIFRNIPNTLIFVKIVGMLFSDYTNIRKFLNFPVRLNTTVLEFKSKHVECFRGILNNACVLFYLGSSSGAMQSGTSTLLNLKLWIKMFEFDSRVRCCELPIHTLLHRIARCFPCSKLISQGGDVVNSTIKALFGHGTQLDFRNIQLAAMLRCVMNFQPFSQAVDNIR